jgi:hypothetical protein
MFGDRKSRLRIEVIILLCGHWSRHFIIRSAAKRSSSDILANSTPLFKEKGHLLFSARPKYLANPFDFHWSRTPSGFPANGRLIRLDQTGACECIDINRVEMFCARVGTEDCAVGREIIIQDPQLLLCPIAAESVSRHVFAVASAATLAGAALGANAAGAGPDHLVAAADRAGDPHEHRAERFPDPFGVAAPVSAVVRWTIIVG